MMSADSAARHSRGGVIFRLMFLLAFAGLLVVLYMARRPILRMAGWYWVVEQAPEKADAIVVQGDNYLAERSAEAANLYHQGWAPRIVATDFQLRPHLNLAELMERDLMDHGVPQSAIIVLPLRPTDTRDQAVQLVPFFQQQGWHHILWVAANYHSRRTYYICQRVLPADIHFRVIAAADYSYDPNSWWKSRPAAKHFFHESVGMVVAMWELRHQAPTANSDWSWLRGDVSAPVTWSGDPGIFSFFCFSSLLISLPVL